MAYFVTCSLAAPFAQAPIIVIPGAAKLRTRNP